MNNSFTEITKSIFERALELDKASREEFFKTLNEEEKNYIGEVKSLLDAFEKNKTFLEVAPSRSIFSDETDAPHPLIGQHIGAYLIEGEIGIGGMGIVFIGKRDDKEFEQKVAIKILKQGLTSEYLVKRFQNERQTLANLQHPNIAKLFDGGKTEEGLPYLIMEYIDGVPITDYCNQHKLNLAERLNLFITVCNAVQYAHQNLVVHRDIKPGNILVNKDGLPKLLDFGVAKLLDTASDFINDGLTKTGMWHLTPDYASPEQIKGEGITTSSDIYSLGVLLYQLISGDSPYKINNLSPVAIIKKLYEDKILPPSEALQQFEANLSDKNPIEQSDFDSSNIKSKQIKGDLDNIVLKAMHKDSNQRYFSVQEFAIDIGRYLKNLPVLARRDSITYRFSKFIQRHKIGFVLFIVGNLLAFISIAAIIYQGNIAAKERDKANIELKKFEEVNDFLLEMFSSADPGAKGKDVKVYDLLDKASKDLNVKLKNQPEIKSAIKQTLGSTFIGLGEFDKAKTLLLESLESNKKLFGLNSKEVAKSYHQLGLCYDWIGNFQLADSFHILGINTYEKLSGKPLKGLADNLNDYGVMLTNFGLYDSAGVLLKRSLDIYGTYNEEKGQKEAITINNLAVNLHHQNKVDEAEKYYLEALKVLTNLYGTNRPEVASIYNNLAFIYMDNKNYDASENAFKKAYEIKTVVLGKEHPSIGLALSNLGMMYFVKEDFRNAETPLLESINLFYKIKATKDPVLSLAYYWLGRTYLESNQLKKSEEVLRKSIIIREEIYSKNHSKTWSSIGELGICLLKQQKYSEAEKQLKEALEFYKNDKFRDLKKISRYTEYSAILYKEIGDKSKASYYQIELETLKSETPSLR